METLKNRPVLTFSSILNPTTKYWAAPFNSNARKFLSQRDVLSGMLVVDLKISADTETEMYLSKGGASPFFLFNLIHSSIGKDYQC